MTGMSAEHTLGQSPKMVWPGLATATLGATLLILGEATDSPRARAAGLGALCSSLLVVALGYIAPPGAVLAPDHDVADSHEHDTAFRVTQYQAPVGTTDEPVRPASAVN